MDIGKLLYELVVIRIALYKRIKLKTFNTTNFKTLRAVLFVKVVKFTIWQSKDIWGPDKLNINRDLLYLFRENSIIRLYKKIKNIFNLTLSTFNRFFLPCHSLQHKNYIY